MNLRLPTIYQYAESTPADSLMPMAPIFRDSSYLALPTFVRYFAARPADLPVRQSTEIELIVNLMAVKAFEARLRRGSGKATTGFFSGTAFLTPQRRIVTPILRPHRGRGIAVR
jgi:hypothetical protein